MNRTDKHSLNIICTISWCPLRGHLVACIKLSVSQCNRARSGNFKHNDLISFSSGSFANEISFVSIYRPSKVIKTLKLSCLSQWTPFGLLSVCNWTKFIGYEDLNSCKLIGIVAFTLLMLLEDYIIFILI